MKRVAKFEKVSYEQFETAWRDTFNKPSLVTDKFIKDTYYPIELPKRSTKFSAGYDFVSPYSFSLKPGEAIKIPTGIRCGMNDDWVLLLFPRSSLGFKYQMMCCNTIPVVDADYYFSDNEGHIFVKLVNRGDKVIDIKKGDKFIQGIFVQYGITEDDNATDTRNGGLGSTGN